MEGVEEMKLEECTEMLLEASITGNYNRMPNKIYYDALIDISERLQRIEAHIEACGGNRLLLEREVQAHHPLEVSQ